MDNFNFISTKGGDLTREFSNLVGVNPYIHRKNKKNTVRFNPKLRESFANHYIGYVVKDGNLYIAFSEQPVGKSSWRVPKKASTASTFWNYVDKFFKGEVSNRYNLNFDRQLEDGTYLFTVTVGEEVEERKGPGEEVIAKGQEALRKVREEREEAKAVEENSTQVTQSEPVTIG